MSFPVHVETEGGYRRIRAARDLSAGEIVAAFEGPVVPWERVPAEEVRHAVMFAPGRWLVPASDARYLNHSCDANSMVYDTLEVATLRPVRRGDELTISYNQADAAEYRSSPEDFFWDERWSFDCRCGSVLCIGRVDGYRITGSGTDWRARVPLTRFEEIPGKGRGVVAVAPIRKGELIERAPALFLPGGQWELLGKTVIFDYCFAWGEELEHAALALGLGSLINHSYRPNAVYIKDLAAGVLDFVALRDIPAGEEVTINYNEDPDDRRPLWFEPLP